VRIVRRQQDLPFIDELSQLRYYDFSKNLDLVSPDSYNPTRTAAGIPVLIQSTLNRYPIG